MAKYYYFDNLFSRFTFGKYKYKPLCKVLLYDPNYLEWCSKNVEAFYINPEIENQIKYLFPVLKIDEVLRGCFGYPIEFYEEDDDYGDCDCNNDYNERPTYDRYNGSYAQDVMGYSDDDIDTIFDGDPSAYWNID